MTDKTNEEDLPNGAGEGDTSTDAPDASSGGDPDVGKTFDTEGPDGVPAENPSGG